jgi:hypothetical protein
MQAVARANQVVVGNRTFSSTNAGRKASFLRQLQDRVQQANSAGYEIKNIDKQVLTQEIRIKIAQQEITNQQKQIDNSQEVEEFLQQQIFKPRALLVDGRADQESVLSGVHARIRFGQASREGISI